MAGVAGSIYAYYLFDVKPPDVFNMNWLFYPILIVVLGGTGTVFGPVIGAFMVSAPFAYGNVYFSGYENRLLRTADHPRHAVHAGGPDGCREQGPKALAQVAGTDRRSRYGRAGRADEYVRRVR